MKELIIVHAVCKRLCTAGKNNLCKNIVSLFCCPIIDERQGTPLIFVIYMLFEKNNTEYKNVLATASNCRSSKNPTLLCIVSL